MFPSINKTVVYTARQEKNPQLSPTLVSQKETDSLSELSFPCVSVVIVQPNLSSLTRRIWKSTLNTTRNIWETIDSESIPCWNVKIGFSCKTQIFSSNEYCSRLIEPIETKIRHFKDTVDGHRLSPDCSPLDYYFWDRIENKIYENHGVLNLQA